MILDSFRLDGKVALVTGAARGLGQGFALAMAEAGADVVVLDRLAPDETCAQIEALGRRAVGLERDLNGTTAESAAAIIADALAAFGRLDILINNAGIIRRSPMEEFSQEDWDTVLSINLNATFFLAQAAGKHFLSQNQQGKIINSASMLSFQGGLFVPSYTAAKSAVAGITRAMANEWASKGINVNAIAPGYMATEVTAGIRANEQREQAILSRIPAGRWGQADDLKGVAVFLASQASDYLHGAVIPVDGGWMSN